MTAPRPSSDRTVWPCIAGGIVGGMVWGVTLLAELPLLIAIMGSAGTAWLAVTALKAASDRRALRSPATDNFTRPDESSSTARQLEFTLKAIGEAVLATDTKGRVVRLNPAGETLLQCWAVDVIGQPWDQLVELRSPDADGRRRDPVAALLRGESAGERGERLVMRRHDATERMVTLTATPVREEEGALRGVVLVFRDVTVEFQLEQQVRRFQGVESLALLAGGVAHDFNNLLQIIRVNLEFLAEKRGLDAEGSEFVGEIQRATIRAADLAHQLLTLGRRQPLRKQAVELVALTTGFLRVMRRLLGPQIEVHFEPSTEGRWVHADAGQLEQVLLNLCLNAREAMPVGGRFTLGIRFTDLTEADSARLKWARPGRFAVLSIQDTGLGMEENAVARLFDPFYQAGTTETGGGLGLSVVWGMIRQHDGFIHVTSELGLGTLFEIFLPEQPAPVPASNAEPLVPPPTSLPQGCVLVVEDDPSVRVTATAVLVRQGYRVVEAADGIEACAIVRERAGELSLVVMDVVMPRKGGVEAAREMVAVRPDLPIVLCTGYSDSGLPEFVEGDDRWHLLQKPFGSEDLLRAVSRALAVPVA